MGVRVPLSSTVSLLQQHSKYLQVLYSLLVHLHPAQHECSITHRVSKLLDDLLLLMWQLLAPLRAQTSTDKNFSGVREWKSISQFNIAFSSHSALRKNPPSPSTELHGPWYFISLRQCSQFADGQKPVWPQLCRTAGLCWVSIPGPLPAKNANQRQRDALSAEIEGALSVLSSTRLHLSMNCWDLIMKSSFPSSWPGGAPVSSVPTNQLSQAGRNKPQPCPPCLCQRDKRVTGGKQNKRKKIPITFTVITAKLYWIYQKEGWFLTCFWILTLQTWKKITRSSKFQFITVY